MSFAWFRLYKELKDDPKIGALSDACFRVFIEAMCWACENADSGDTGLTLEAANWAFRRDVQEPIRLLLEAKLLTIGGDGRIFVTKWENRQFPSDHSTYRVRKHRELQNETAELPFLKRSCNGQTPVQDETRLDETRLDSDKKRGGVGEVSDSDWIKSLQSDKAYKHLNVEVEYSKMCRWCRENRKQPTRRRFINWLNRIDKPMETNGVSRKGPTMFELKTVLDAKTQEATGLYNRHYSKAAMGGTWDNESARLRYVKLKSEIKAVQAQISDYNQPTTVTNATATD